MSSRILASLALTLKLLAIGCSDKQSSADAPVPDGLCATLCGARRGHFFATSNGKRTLGEAPCPNSRS